MNHIIPYILIVISIYSIIPQHYLSRSCREKRVTKMEFLAWCLMGCYGGGVGIGTGPLMIAVHRIINGSILQVAIAETKPLLFIINITSLLFLVLLGHLWWQLGLLLAVGNILGALLGARITTSRYVTVAKFFVFIVPMAAGIKMLVGY